MRVHACCVPEKPRATDTGCLNLKTRTKIFGILRLNLIGDSTMFRTGTRNPAWRTIWYGMSSLPNAVFDYYGGPYLIGPNVVCENG